MHQLIDDLKWRYAVKKYDSSKKISENDIEILKHAINLTPTSIGLQPFKMLHIKDEALRKQIQACAHNQAQVVDASDLFIFCNFTKVEDSYFDFIVEIMATIRGKEVHELSGYRNFIQNSVFAKSDSELDTWASKQTYIALGLLLQSAAILKIDATPMEGFDQVAINKLLNLEEKSLSVSLLCPLGYRSPEDNYQHLKKSRKPLSALFEEI
jgi:nitroreductase